MIYPVDPKHKITQYYGENPARYPQTTGHNGLDFGCPEGTQIHSVVGGLVTFAGLDPVSELLPKCGYGLMVRVQGLQYSVIYGHLTKLLCHRDEQVDPSQVIGLSGGVTPPTGYSTGAHLHFEVRTGSSIATCIDPLPILNKDEQPGRKPIFYAEVACDSLLIRRDPSRSHGYIGSMPRGTVVPVYALLGSEVWVEHDKGFSAFRLASDVLMKFHSEDCHPEECHPEALRRT